MLIMLIMQTIMLIMLIMLMRTWDPLSHTSFCQDHEIDTGRDPPCLYFLGEGITGRRQEGFPYPGRVFFLGLGGNSKQQYSSSFVVMITTTTAQTRPLRTSQGGGVYNNTRTGEVGIDTQKGREGKERA